MIGEKIKFIRQKQNLNQREFAKQFNISKSSLCNYERNNTEIPFSLIIEIAKYYRLDANIFVYDNLFDACKENFECLNTKICKHFKSLYDSIYSCFKKISFHEQGLPEIIEIYKIKLNKFIVQINFVINAANESYILISIIKDLIIALKKLCLSLDVFLVEYTKSKYEIRHLLSDAKQKIAYIYNLYNNFVG